jgi:hypothetical protein
MASKMYIEKSLEYTVKGIEILRNETIQLFQNRNNYLSFGTGAIALLFYSAATSQYNYPFLTYVVLLLAIPLLSCFLIIISLYINVQIVNLCRYLRSREMLLTYLLESIYENDEKTVFNEKKACNIENGKKLTPIQKQIRELLFEDKPSKITSSIHNHDQILRNQIPIYWERYILNPIPDKLKVIDLQSYMITWMFSIIALISYCTALIFRVSVKAKCTGNHGNCFDDIILESHNFVFFKDYNILKNVSDTQIICVLIGFLSIVYVVFFWLRFNEKREMTPLIFLILFLILIVYAVFYSFFFDPILDTNSLFSLVFLLIPLMTLFFNIFGENIVVTVRGEIGKKFTREELTKHNPMPIAKDYYSLFLNLTSFLIVIYFLRFHTELSVFIIILSTFSYSIFWQIPQFRKTAHRPLNVDIFIKENYYD